jgi:tetratricopeptide (TPR) repeat protein
MTSARDPELTLRLIGPLRLLRRDGTDVTPRGAKAQGLLALLGVSPGLRRSRAWLKDKLWSDREDEQSSASLRQVLSLLRREVATEAPWLVSQGHWVVLDGAQVTVALHPGPGDVEVTGEPSEFCEGLDIPDPEFEDWIRDQRMAWADRLAEVIVQLPTRAAPPALAGPPRWQAATLLVAPPQAADESLRALASLISSEVAGRVARMGGATVLMETAGEPPATGNAVRLQTRAMRIGDRAVVQAEFCDAAHGALLWASSRTTRLGPGTGSVSEMEALVAAIVAAATLQMGREAGPAAAGYRALRHLFAFDPEQLSRSDKAFATAAENHGAPVLQAWRAHLRVISLIERLATDRDRTAQEAMDLAFHALEDDPLNPIVNAIAADVALHVEDRPVKAATLAQLGVDLDPASPFTHASLAQALARLGQAPAAHVEAMRGMRLSVGQPNQAWWYMRCSVTAVRCGRLEAAVRFAQMAHELSPEFKAPLRFLAALQFHLRDEEGALKALAALKALEPDFSLDLMASDSYPLATLRSAGLLEVAGSGLI